jgi:hypothetical protein
LPIRGYRHINDITLAAGVITWAWSPIKFQADMGILLTFMSAWNMVGALVLIPALTPVIDRQWLPAVAPSARRSMPRGLPCS